MGRHISATLAFGVDLGDEMPFNSGTEDDPDTDLGKYLADQSGARDPWEDVPRDIYNGPYDEFKRWETENPEWSERLHEWQELCSRLEKESPVEVDYYGTLYGENYYVLVLKKGKQEADWGAPTKIQVSNIGDEGGVTERRIRKAREFCELNGLPSFDDASWLLYVLEG